MYCDSSRPERWHETQTETDQDGTGSTTLMTGLDWTEPSWIMFADSERQERMQGCCVVVRVHRPSAMSTAGAWPAAAICTVSTIQFKTHHFPQQQSHRIRIQSLVTHRKNSNASPRLIKQMRSVGLRLLFEIGLVVFMCYGYSTTL